MGMLGVEEHWLYGTIAAESNVEHVFLAVGEGHDVDHM